MRLPKNWNQITVERFQECYFILGKDPTIDSWILVLSVLSGKSKDYIESLPIRELKLAIHRLQFLLNPELNEKVNKYVSINGRVFKAAYLASELQTNEVADLKGFMVADGQSVNDTVVENAHKLLACIYIPLTLRGFRYVPSKHKEVSEYFRKAKMGDVYGTLFFYSETYKNLMEATNTFGEQQAEILKNHLKEVEEWTQNTNLESVGGGK